MHGSVPFRSSQTLKDERWLNDEVVNWQLALLNDIAYDRWSAKRNIREPTFSDGDIVFDVNCKLDVKDAEEREGEKIQLHYQAKLYYDYGRVKRMLRKKAPHPYDC